MSRLTGAYALFFFIIVAATTLAARVTRQTCLEEICYFIPHDVVFQFGSSLNVSSSIEDFIPFTVVNVNGANRDKQDILNRLAYFDAVDDVWSPAFATHVYVQRSANTASVGNINEAASENLEIESIFYSSAVEQESTLPEGPYFLDTNSRKLFKAYRLYDDTQQAFIQSSYQAQSGFHANLQAGIASAGSLAVAVPSRIYYQKSSTQPLAGVRLAVKDLFDLKGMKTSGGNRAYFATTQEANETAIAVQNLIDAGAVVVGKNKLSEFAWAGPYHMDHLGYLLPFNPRGDGYQSPGDSSGGSAASVASYDWLDLAIGSDTGGSIRGPAALNGVHGNRPSTGAVDLNGAIPFSTAMDTAGFLTRDPLIWADAIDALYNGTIQNYSSFPTTLFADADDLPGTDELYQTKVEDIYWQFTLDLASAIGAEIKNMSTIDTIWNDTRPAEYSDTPLFNAYSLVYANLTRYDQANKCGFPFLSAFRSAHNGSYPYVAAQIINGWETLGRSMDESMYQGALDRKATIARWAADNLFKADAESCTDSLFVNYYGPGLDPRTVLSDGDPNPSVAELYTQIDTLTSELQACRNGSTPSSSSGPTSASIMRLASIADLPMSIITLGDFVSDGNYTYSSVTRQKQRASYSVGLTTRHGCDFVLSRVIRLLAQKGIIKTVRAGASSTLGGEIGL